MIDLYIDQQKIMYYGFKYIDLSQISLYEFGEEIETYQIP